VALTEFAGRVAVITGGASGMGRAFAERFGAEGMRLVLADIEEPILQATVEALRGRGMDVTGVVTDVSSLESVRELARQAVERFGKVHLVCNNAGVEGYLDGPIWEATDKDWAWTFGVNYWGVVHGIRTFLPLMLSGGDEGWIVNTASATGLVRANNMYGITKHAVVALSEVVYAELHARSALVGISALCPGVVHTRIFEGSRNRPAALQNEVPTSGADAGRELRARMISRTVSALEPSVVADLVLRAVRTGQFYILTDTEWDERIRSRHASIMARGNPDLTVR
jgi:NAD(P)-dependent dehydrogenase (short-subunit alcohol dehydrogenase family)